MLLILCTPWWSLWVWGDGLASCTCCWYKGRGGGPFKQALWFGVVVFGISWVLFAMFGFLFVEQSLLLPLLGAGIDIVFVVAAVWVFERSLSTTGRVNDV
jgi:hypothetical protein